MVHISLGENCLVQNLLLKKNLTQETLPFSYLYTDIRFVTEVINNGFRIFIERGVLNQYPEHKWRFFHYKMNRISTIDSFIRKINRFQSHLINDQIVFWYNYRYNKDNDINSLIKDFQAFDEQIKADAKYIILVQNINQKKQDFKHYQISKFNIIECYDQNIWEGENYDGKTFSEQFDKLLYEYKILNKL